VWDIARELLERQRDFDFVDEQSLSSILELGNGTLTNLSGQSYRAVIVPSVSVISKTALDRLREFAASGGCVIFLGREPSLLVERTFLKATGPPDLDWAARKPSGELTACVMEALPQADVLFDIPCPSVKYLRRRWRDADLYFFFNESDEERSFQTTLAGNGQVQVWDATSGRIEVLAGVSSENGIVRLPLTLAPYDSRFMIIGPVTSVV
ncbi:glycosyl hydrolase, partial [Candidatus Poribacteria bacterium]